METLGDQICELCNKHYNSLPKRGKPDPAQWTVLSAIVLEQSSKPENEPSENRNEQSSNLNKQSSNLNNQSINLSEQTSNLNKRTRNLRVITMATGTKCVGEKHKTPHIVSDSHAEVLCLRLLRLFLMEDMKACLEHGAGLCLRRGSGRTFEVKEGVALHFYSSCVMCGDATISTDCGESEDNNNHLDKIINPAACDKKRSPAELTASDSKLLKLDNTTRTGAKCLISDNLHRDSLKARSWHKTAVLRTKPGRGPVCLSLSCSDKLMKRQALGLQGGLLSQFLPDPIRFTSFSIGGEFSEKSVNRALFDRLPESFQSIQPVYKVKDTFANSVNNCRAKSDVQDACSTSLLWMMRGESGVKWVGVKGKLQGATKTSSPDKVMLPVCRVAMLQRAMSIFTLFENSSSDQTAEIPNSRDDLEAPTTCSRDVTKLSRNVTPNTGVDMDTISNLVHKHQDLFRKQYNSFKCNPCYSLKKAEFCKNFTGWDRKISNRSHKSSERVNVEKSTL